MKNLPTFENFINESEYAINEAKAVPCKVMGSIGDFQLFDRKDGNKEIILIVTDKTGSQYEFPVIVKASATKEKLKERFYSGKAISIPTEWIESFK